MSTTNVEPVVHVGLDASWRESGALEWALQECSLRHEPMAAVHVIDERLRRTPYWEPTVIDDAAMHLMDEVQAYLDNRAGSLDHEIDVTVGRPAETLVQRAAGGRMLVVGRRGIGGFKRLLIGSTSEAVAAEADLPVVIVPDRWKPDDPSGPVLIALDGSGDDQAAIVFAVNAASVRHLPLRLLHAWDMPHLYSGYALNAPGLVEECEADVRRHFREVAEHWRARHPELVIDVDIWRGHPVDCIVRAAEHSDAQLLVLGGRRRRRLSSMLLGSVARGVVRYATCPVAVVHVPPDK